MSLKREPAIRTDNNGIPTRSQDPAYLVEGAYFIADMLEHFIEQDAVEGRVREWESFTGSTKKLYRRTISLALAPPSDALFVWVDPDGLLCSQVDQSTRVPAIGTPAVEPSSSQDAEIAEFPEAIDDVRGHRRRVTGLEVSYSSIPVPPRLSALFSHGRVLSPLSYVVTVSVEELGGVAISHHRLMERVVRSAEEVCLIRFDASHLQEP
jgi:hypothetical protein